MRLRGPGDLFGIRQSGILDFKLGDVFQDSQVLQQASEVANLILEEDPQLEKEKYESLKQQVQKIIQGGMLETTL